MITMDVKYFSDPTKIPFYSWECLSLQLKCRDVDLVIRDQDNMDKLLKLLIYQMDTVDGDRNSSLPYQTVLMQQY
jgi:hypothetical protein